MGLQYISKRNALKPIQKVCTKTSACREETLKRFGNAGMLDQQRVYGDMLFTLLMGDH